MQKSKIIGNFFPRKTTERAGMVSNSPDLNPIENLCAILKHLLQKQTVHCENLEFWNEIDPYVIRNMYEKYTNRLLDVKKLKV